MQRRGWQQKENDGKNSAHSVGPDRTVSFVNDREVPAVNHCTLEGVDSKSKDQGFKVPINELRDTREGERLLFDSEISGDPQGQQGRLRT